MTLQWTEGSVDRHVEFAPEIATIQTDSVRLSGHHRRTGEIDVEMRRVRWPPLWCAITIRFDGYELTGKFAIASSTASLTVSREEMVVGSAIMTMGYRTWLLTVLRSL